MTIYQYKSKAHGDWINTKRPYKQDDLEYRVKPDHEEIVKYYDFDSKTKSFKPNLHGSFCITYNKETGQATAIEKLL